MMKRALGRVCVHDYACAQICAQIAFLGETPQPRRGMSSGLSF
jgi:hypothetical protein